MATPARPHRRLVWKYVAVVVAAGRRGHRLGRDQRVLLLLRGQQAGRDRGRGGQGVVRRRSRSDQFIQELLRRPRGRGPADRRRPDRNGSRAVIHEPVPAAAGDQRADVPRCDGHGVRARLLQRGRQDRQPDLRGDRSDSEEFRRARAEQRYFGSVAFEPARWPAAHDRRGGRGARRARASSSRTSTWDPSSTRSAGRRSAPRATPTRSMSAARSSPTPRTSASSSPTPTSAALPQVRCRTGRARRRPVAWSPTDAIPQGTRGAERVRERRPARLAGVRRGAAERGVRTHPGGDLAHRGAPGRVPPGGDRDERAARPQSRQADRGDPGRGGEDRLRVARSADRGLQPRRARRPRRRVQPDGCPAPGVLCRARAAGPGADPRAGQRRWPSWTRRPASSRPPVATSRSSWPTCRTSCGRR